MITLYYAEPGCVSIRELYDRADTYSRRVFDDSEKEAPAYMSLFCRVLTDVGLADLGADPEQITIERSKYGKDNGVVSIFSSTLDFIRSLLCLSLLRRLSAGFLYVPQARSRLDP